jgi:hypothetical protein
LPQFTIIAVEDETEVEITPTSWKCGSTLPMQTFTITLQ